LGGGSGAAAGAAHEAPGPLVEGGRGAPCGAPKAEHAGVWSWGAGKTAAGVTAAAVRPVPAAVKTGWTNGRDRHRAKAGNRPAPVALDLPWWHREQPQVQPEEQAAGTAQEQDPKQGEQR
jgi:hypothetical protein